MLVAATACWGTGTVVTKQVLGSFQPLTLLPQQLAASCVFLLLAIRLNGARIAWSPQMTRLTLLGILNPGVAYALGLLGLASISASMSVLLWALEPVLILLLAVALLREHISSRPLPQRSLSPCSVWCWSSSSPAQPVMPSGSCSPWPLSVHAPSTRSSLAACWSTMPPYPWC